MIERVADFNSLSGVSSPLLPLLYVDFKFAENDIDGVYCQIIDGEKTVVFSLKSCCANVIKLSDNYEGDELKAFFNFAHIDNIVADFKFDDNLKDCVFMGISLKENDKTEVCVLSKTSVINDYKAVFSLLNGGNNFDDWFPSFSKKINYGNGAAVYISENGISVSCAVSPAVFSDIGIIGGVFTEYAYRLEGYGSRSVKALLNTISSMGASKAYLWCEKCNEEFYKKLGFSNIGCLYIREEF